MYIYSPSLRNTLAEITPNILSYTRSSIIFDRRLYSAINDVTAMTSTLDDIPSIIAEAKAKCLSLRDGQSRRYSRLLAPMGLEQPM